jgi:hypothetical protein
MKPTIFFGYSKKISGTPLEESLINYIENKFPDYRLINPSDFPEIQPFEAYLKSIDKVDFVVVSEFQKHIGKGVYQEIERALALQKPVKVIRQQSNPVISFAFRLYTVKGIQVIDENDWPLKYGKIITTSQCMGEV